MYNYCFEEPRNIILWIYNVSLNNDIIWMIFHLSNSFQCEHLFFVVSFQLFIMMYIENIYEVNLYQMCFSHGKTHIPRTVR